MIEFCAPRARGAECRRSAALAGFAGAGFELGPPRLASCSLPSHQTTQFPPTPSNHSTSASHVRMIKLQYYTLTVIHISATIPCDSSSPHILAFHLLTIHHPLPTLVLCERTATAATPFRSCAYFTILWIPQGRGSPAFLPEHSARHLPLPFRSPPRIFRRSGLQPRH